MAAAKKAQPAAEGRTTNKGMVCAAKGCPDEAKSRGLCLKHYTQERRLDPEVRRKANEASKRTAAKRRAEKAAAEAPRGKTIAGRATNGDLVVIAQTEHGDISAAKPAARRKPAAKKVAEK